METRAKIYLADPDAGVVRFLRGALEPQGYKVQEAMDWGQLPEEVRLFGAQIILLSTEIPGFYYGDLIRLVRNHAKVRELPLLVLVSGTDQRGIRDSLEQGASDFVIKPLVVVDLLNKLRLHLPQKEAKPAAAAVPAPAPVAAGRPQPDDPRFLTAIADVADAAASSLAPEDAFYVLVKRLATLVPTARCAVAMKGIDADEAFLVAAHDEPGLKHQRVDLAQKPAWRRVLDQGEAHLPEGDAALEWVLPIVVRERPVGLLVLKDPRPAKGEAGPARLLCRVMTQLAAAVTKSSDALENVKFRSVEEKAPAEGFDNIVLDLNDQIEVLIEELENK